MRFVSVRELRGKSAEVWRKLAEDKDMVVTSKGKPLALLSILSEETLEEELAALRKARAIAGVDALQRRSMKRGARPLSLEEIEAEIREVRRARSR